jgi:hypothetical protein
MSPSDVPPDEMGTDPNATDDALDRMLSGGAPAEDEWRDLALFVQELQEAVPSSGLASEDLHVAAMVGTAHLLAEKGDPASRPVSNAAAPAPQVSGLPKQRRKPMKSIVTRVLAPIAAVLTVFGGMAYAGALPHQVQKAVSHAAGTVGINVPGDDEGTGEVPGEDDQGEDTQGDTGKEDSVTPPADDQGENDDSQGDNTNQGEDTQGDSTDQTSSDDQGENDDSQGDNNNQGEDTQGDSTDQTSGDDQGDTTQSNDQGGDTSGDSQSGDSQSGDTTSGGGDQQGDSQD